MNQIRARLNSCHALIPVKEKRHPNTLIGVAFVCFRLQNGGGVRARVQIQVSHLLELAAPTLARLY